EAESLAYVKIDKQRMTQVFMNLVLNAIQAIPPDQAEKKIDILFQEEKSFVLVKIKDNGVGIAKENLDKLFTPFFTTKKMGTGLGLSIVHRIIEEHLGKISVQSSLEQGTTFSIWLPKAQDTEEFLAKIEDGTANTHPLIDLATISVN
ncbi:MAG: GHKL domain-containing protein, partial [Candidatus Margulisbacteria bacterium]|nr:GHKL domain-containing protein [Candidatus Margulisiibacteriota bacterium]